LLDDCKPVIFGCFECLELHPTRLGSLQELFSAFDRIFILESPNAGVLFAELVDDRLVSALFVVLVVLVLLAVLRVQHCELALLHLAVQVVRTVPRLVDVLLELVLEVVGLWFES
jgi:hypothetical protein